MYVFYNKMDLFVIIITHLSAQEQGIYNLALFLHGTHFDEMIIDYVI